MARKERRGFLTLNRVIFFSIALVLASLPTLLFADFLWRTEIDGPKIALIVLFAMLAGNVAWGATHAICGFADRRLGRSKTILDSLKGVDLSELELPAVAVALPVYNEDPQRVFAGLRSMYESLMKTGKDWSLLKEDTTMEGVAGAALYLLSDLGRSCTGEVLHVDAGFHAVAVPDIGEDG